MAKITPRSTDSTIVVKTNTSTKANRPEAWWKASTQSELVEQVLGTAAFLKEQQQFRYRQAALYGRLYSNYPMFGWVGTNLSKMALASQLPTDRPTLNVIQSCVDTLVSRITQSRPRPMFLTDDGDYKERKLAKQLNNFVNGEFYQCKAYKHGEQALRDSLIWGTGVIKIFEHEEKVRLERRILTELLVDPNDGIYGHPRQMYELQLIDRSVLQEMFSNKSSMVSKAEQAFPDTAADSSKTIADQVMVVEAWRLPSSSEANDGRHVIACSSGILLDEKWEKKHFPFVFLNFSDRPLGYWGQGLSEQLMGTQTEINKLLMTISASINLVGVPRVFVEDGSKVVKAHLNNQIGAIVTYRGTKPQYEIAPCIPQEVYAQLERLVNFAYQQSGVSALAASSQKPAGLNSGEAIRSYDDLQSDRFASTQKKYSTLFEELAYQMFDVACDIAKRTGKYQTIYPNKNGAKQIDLPEISEEKRNAFVIQCFDISSLPKDPAGRLQKITEMIQAGMIDIREGRRLLDFPDLEQVEKLANASEERILQTLDAIVEDGKYTPPDPFMDLQLALKLSVQYYNLYAASKLEPEKAEMLRTFNTQVNTLIQQSMPQQPMQAQPLAAPQPRPTSELVPNVPVQGMQ